MEKELVDLTFKELVALGVELELNNIVRGETLARRVSAVMELAVRWRHEKTKAEGQK